MAYEKEILDAAVRISEARYRNEYKKNLTVKALIERISELEQRIDNLLEALEDADEYIEELETK